MKIKVFYHLNDSPGFNEVMGDQLTKMSESGLLDALDEGHFCTNGREESFYPAIAALADDYKKIKFHHVSNDAKNWEWYSLDNLRRNCVAHEDEEFYVCYVHLKGLTRLNDPKILDWRNFMDYGIIEQWKECVALLDKGHDTVGVNFIENPTLWPHYSGNFWWARASYIRKLEPLTNPAAIQWGSPGKMLIQPNGSPVLLDQGNFRFEHEAWICSGKPNWAEVASSPGKHDVTFHPNNLYPRTEYATSEV